MPFPFPVLIHAALRARYRCEVCRRDVSEVEESQTTASFEIHSLTSLHLVVVRESRNLCIVTDPPSRFEVLRGRLLPIRMFKIFQYRRLDDGFCLCHKCHRKIHQVALKETKRKVPDFTGRNAIPTVLEMVSLYYIQRGSL